jgi:opacity protein-like surface antigen
LGQGSAFEQYVRVGVNGTQVSGDGLEGFNKAGLAGGFGVIRKFKNKLSYDISINYSQKGSRMPIDTINKQKYLMRLHYVEVPIILHWELESHINLNVGFAFARLLSTLEEDAFGKLPVSNPFEKNEFSILFGLDYYFTEKIGVSFNYLNSLRPFRKHPGNVVAPAGLVWRQNDGQYNNVLALSFNFKI